jgi:hypothetical protein
VIRVRGDLAVEVKRDRLVVRRDEANVEVFPDEIRHLVNALAEALPEWHVGAVLKRSHALQMMPLGVAALCFPPPIECTRDLHDDLLQQGRPNVEAGPVREVAQYEQHFVLGSLTATDRSHKDADGSVRSVPEGLSDQTSRRIVGKEDGIEMGHHQGQSRLLSQAECKHANQRLKGVVIF